MSKHENPKHLRGAPLSQDEIVVRGETAASSETAAPTAPPAAATNTAPASRTRRRIAKLAAVIATAVVLYEGYDYWSVGRFLYATDDAYLKADISIVSAKVAGYVSELKAAENARVESGATLAVIDPGDYQIAIASARAKLVAQDATIDRLGKQVGAQNAAIDQARAQIGSAKADVARTQADFQRTDSLAKSQYASIKSLDQARADQTKATQSVVSAQAALAVAEANLAVAQAQQQEAIATKADLQTSLDKAERDLAFATVKAPIDGIVGNRAAHVGDYVQPGTRLMSLVPVSEIYVEANFKETQLARMKPGQKATVTVDALGGLKIEGTVDSLSPASGSLYSLLPPENATGNFTKIVQRLPVRIKLPADRIAEGGLRAGLSVIVSVDTREQPEHSTASGR